MKYEVIRTDTADSLIRKIILHVAENFGDYVALEKLDNLSVLRKQQLTQKIAIDG